MIVIDNEKFFTIDDIVDLTGYQKNTIYNFTTEKIISPPIKGLIEADYQSQGLYREVVFTELSTYRQLKLSGLRKSEIIEYFKSARTTNESLLPLLETRGQSTVETVSGLRTRNTGSNN